MREAVNLVFGTVLLLFGAALTGLTVVLFQGLPWVLVPCMLFALFVEYALYCAWRLDLEDARDTWRSRHDRDLKPGRGARV